MERVSIDIPSEDLAWAQGRVEAGEAESLGDYFRALTERDREESDKVRRLNKMLQDGIDSGVDPRSQQQIFAEVRAKYNL